MSAVHVATNSQKNFHLGSPAKKNRITDSPMAPLKKQAPSKDGGWISSGSLWQTIGKDGKDYAVYDAPPEIAPPPKYIKYESRLAAVKNICIQHPVIVYVTAATLAVTMVGGLLSIYSGYMAEISGARNMLELRGKDVAHSFASDLGRLAALVDLLAPALLAAAGGAEGGGELPLPLPAAALRAGSPQATAMALRDFPSALSVHVAPGGVVSNVTVLRPGGELGFEAEILGWLPLLSALPRIAAASACARARARIMMSRGGGGGAHGESPQALPPWAGTGVTRGGRLASRLGQAIGSPLLSQYLAGPGPAALPDFTAPGPARPAALRGPLRAPVLEARAAPAPAPGHAAIVAAAGAASGGAAGWVGVVVDLTVFAESPLLAALEEDHMGYELVWGSTYRGGPRLARSRTDFHYETDKPPGEVEVVLPGATWLLVVSPTEEWSKYIVWVGPVSATGFLFNLMFTMFLFGFLVKMYQHRHLLHAMLPSQVVRLLARGQHYVERYENVTVLVCNIVSYSSLSAELSPEALVVMLNDIYSMFDEIVDQHSVYKVDTNGEGIIVVGGAPVACGAAEAACEIARFASSMLIAADNYSNFNGQRVRVRIGIHSGPVVAGVIGMKMPRWCLFGDTVTTALAVEEHGAPSAITVSGATRDLLERGEEAWRFTESARGDGVFIRGKGVMPIYAIEPPATWAPPCSRRDPSFTDVRACGPTGSQSLPATPRSRRALFYLDDSDTEPKTPLQESASGGGGGGSGVPRGSPSRPLHTSLSAPDLCDPMALPENLPPSPSRPGSIRSSSSIRSSNMVRPVFPSYGYLGHRDGSQGSDPEG